MKLMPAILIGGALAGLGDITYAIIHYGMPPANLPAERVLQSVAAGLVGPEQARAGGWGTAALGLTAHFSIAIIMAAVFNAAALFVPLLKKLWFVTGPLYGLGLLFVMNYVVVPYSATGRSAALPQGDYLYGAIFAHVVLVGLVIAFFASRVKGADPGDITPGFLQPKDQ
jgi:hypothetical protein